jgi:hypothetical protein
MMPAIVQHSANRLLFFFHDPNYTECKVISLLEVNLFGYRRHITPGTNNSITTYQ